ncbi:MAG: HEPN domain-containing protein [Treponema sp.]|jgi:HEPN domain-containing protein|nr:HEPN domain-containing protein [Treponema sp.]
MKKQVEDWILLADNDLYVAEIIIKDDYPLTNIIAFHCQQTIEKYLKAYLMENDVPLIKTHDLIKWRRSAWAMPSRWYRWSRL